MNSSNLISMCAMIDFKCQFDCLKDTQTTGEALFLSMRLFLFCCEGSPGVFAFDGMIRLPQA
jgi:hypothetical protein